MDYRTRWQQRRRRQTRRRFVMAIVVVGVLVGGLTFVRQNRRPRELWQYSFGVPSPVLFVVDGESLFCGLPGGVAGALRLGSGRPLWPEPFKRSMGFGVPPAASRTRVVFATDNGTVCALARPTGELLWEVETGAAVRCPPLIAGNAVYVGSDDGNLYAFSLDTGAERWRVAAGAPVNSGCALVKNTLVFGTVDGDVFAVDPATGRLRWPARSVGMPVFGQPVAMGEFVAVPTDGGAVIVMEPNTGRQVSRLTIPGYGLVRSAPVIDEARLYAATTDGWVAAFDRASRKPVWARRVGHDLSAGPALDDWYLYCGDGRAGLVVVDKHEGRVVQRWQCPADVRGSVVVVRGMVLVATGDGQVVAYRAPTPRHVKKLPAGKVRTKKNPA